MIGPNELLCTMVVSVAACAVPVAAATAQDSLAVDGSVEKSLRENSVVGATWAIIDLEGSGWVRVFGDASAHSNSPVTTETRFRAGSFSKNLTALVALRLQALDAIDLDAPIQSSAMVYGFNGPEEPGITLASLLEHTAGLPGSSYRDYATSLPNAGTAEFLSTFAPFQVRWRPQWFFSYSNPGYGVAAAVLGEASGRSFDELMQAEVFDPLGLDSASFENAGYPPDLVATGHDQNGKPQPTWAMLARPAGSLTITASDLARVVAMYLRRGRLEDGSEFLPEELIERMERGETSAAARAGVRAAAYGLGNFGFAIDGRIWRGHWGKTDGFLTNVGYLPEHGIGFVLMINTDSPAAMRECRSIIATHLTEGQPEPERPPLARESIDPSIAGDYVNATHDMPIRDWLFRGLDQKRVRVEGDTLSVESLSPHGASSETYRPVTSGGFMPDSLPLATAAVTQLDGQQYWLEGEAYVRVTTAEAVIRRHLPLAATGSSALLLVVCVIRGFWRRREHTNRSERLLQKGYFSAIAVASVAFLVTFWMFVRFGLLGSSAELKLVGQVTPLSITLAVGSLVTVVSVLIATPIAIVRAARKPWLLWRLGEAMLFLPLLFVAMVWISGGWFPLMTWR